MARLLVCDACARHVHDTEEQCPFCDAVLARRPSELATPGLSRAAQYALSAAFVTGAAVSASCKDEGPASKAPTDGSADRGQSTGAPTSTAALTATANAVATASAREVATVPSSTASAVVTTTATVVLAGYPCGSGTCTAAEVCFHPCTPCGGQTARMGHCPPQAPPRCVPGGAPQGARAQGRDAYQSCPAMPYGCVFPNGCGSVSV